MSRRGVIAILCSATCFNSGLLIGSAVPIRGFRNQISFQKTSGSVGNENFVNQAIKGSRAVLGFVFSHPLLVALGLTGLAKSAEYAWMLAKPWLVWSFNDHQDLWNYLDKLHFDFLGVEDFFKVACASGNRDLLAGVKSVLKKFLGGSNVVVSPMGLKLNDANELDGALFLLSHCFSSGSGSSMGNFKKVLLNLRKLFVPGYGEYDRYKPADSAVQFKDGESYGITAGEVKDNAGADESTFASVSRYLKGEDHFKRVRPFNPMPLIYLIRQYILNHEMPSEVDAGLKGKPILLSSIKHASDSRLKGNVAKDDKGSGSEPEDYIAWTRTGNKLTGEFWLGDTSGDNNECYKLCIDYTVPDSKGGANFDSRFKVKSIGKMQWKDIKKSAP